MWHHCTHAGIHGWSNGRQRGAGEGKGAKWVHIGLKSKSKSDTKSGWWQGMGRSTAAVHLERLVQCRTVAPHAERDRKRQQNGCSRAHGDAAWHTGAAMRGGHTVHDCSSTRTAGHILWPVAQQRTGCGLVKSPGALLKPFVERKLGPQIQGEGWAQGPGCNPGEGWLVLT